MYGFLLALLVLDGIFLGVVILLQSGKGGGLAAVGGGAAMTEGVLGGRQATNMLTRATWSAGTLFMVLALVLSIISSRSREPESVLEQNLQQETAPVPQPLIPGVQEEGPGGPPGAAQPPGSDATGGSGGSGPGSGGGS